jgi:MOSC domain-containing protein YiiM
MHGVSVCLFVGAINPLPQSGRPTGMYKQPVTGLAEIGVEGFLDDKQADRRVHGGPEKAIHLYLASHYRKLAEKFPEAANQLVPGSLGENISTSDLDERGVHLGDVWQLGTSLIQAASLSATKSVLED